MWGTSTIAAVVAGLACLGACSKRAEPVAVEPTPLPVTVVHVQDGSSADPTERYPVTITRDREANLSFRVAGIVRTIPVRIGQRVAVNSVLATLDPTPYVAARVRADEEVSRLSRSAERNRSLVPAGALAPSASEDTDGAVATARALLASARYDEASAVARAPFNGVVLTRDAEVGETVNPGQRLLRIADLGSPLIARAAVPRDVSNGLRVGDGARVSVGADRAVLAATVRHVGAAADLRTGTVEMELVIDGDFPSGSVGSVSFAKSSSPNATSGRLPAEALLDVSGKRGHVFVVDPEAKARKVELAVDGFDGEALRVSGLSTDARVITYGAGFVREGQKVTVIAR